MRFSDFIFVVVVTILLAVPMFLFFESDASKLPPPSLQTLKAIYDPLWAIAMGMTVVIMAVTLFVKKDDELTLKFGLPAMAFLLGVQIIVNQMPI